MRETPLYRVRWAGGASFEEVRDRLLRFGHAEIQLPPDYHYALYQRFQGSSDTTAQLLQVNDGADLMHRILEVKGLEDLADVEALVRETGAHVELVSPVPLITLHIRSESS